MTWLATAITVVLAALATLPGVYLASTFGEFLGMPLVEAAQGDPAAAAVLAAILVSILPGQIVGLVAGFLAIGLTSLIIRRADYDQVATGAFVVAVAIAAIGVVTSSVIEGLTLVLQLPGYALGYFLTARMVGGGEKWTRWPIRGAITAMVIACAVVPLLTIRPVQPRADLPTFQPVEVQRTLRQQ